MLQSCEYKPNEAKFSSSPRNNQPFPTQTSDLTFSMPSTLQSRSLEQNSNRKSGQKPHQFGMLKLYPVESQSNEYSVLSMSLA